MEKTRGGISTVIANYRASDQTADFDVTFIPTHCDGGRLSKAAVAARALLRTTLGALTKAPDIIHVHVGDFPSLYRKALVMLPYLLRRNRRILHFHGAAFLDQYAALTPRRQALVRRILGYFDLVICLSDSWRQEIEATFAPRRTVVLPNAVHMPQRASAPRADSAPLELLFLGLIGPRKGVFDLLDAVERAVARGADVRLSIGGNGEVDRLRERLATSPALADRVRYLGWVTAEDRDAAFASAHAYVLPSYAEGMPMSVIEAMSYGLPVITCPVGGIPELVEDGTTGALVAPGAVDSLADAICRLASDETLRQSQGAAAADRVRRDFELGAHVKRITGLYREVLSPAKMPSDRFGEVPVSFREALRGDRVRNKKNSKGLLIAAFFRLAQASHRLGARHRALRIITIIPVTLYKLIVDYVLTVYLPPSAKIGPGLVIFHGYAIVINENAVLGRNVTIRQSVTIGAKNDAGTDAPTIGDDVDIGAGAVVIGPITVGNGAVIGAGAIVVHDVAPGEVVVGNPARPISSHKPN
jgi:glycosyltransferase involved in cell wall biosynthesis/serine acetyltransferase